MNNVFKRLPNISPGLRVFLMFLVMFSFSLALMAIADDGWRKGVVSQLVELVKRDRNHPSIVLWGVRINESLDDDELYKRTNEAAHYFDPSRQTGGVRNIASSHLLEDVYTYNDFSQPGLSNPKSITKVKGAPYLVSEHSGHMYPARRIDGYEKQTQLALFHALKIESLFANPSISGAIGWCMSDYLTHREFGPSDNVCYHGVSDQFRIPKLVASVYASQSNISPVLQVSHNAALGSFPSHAMPPLYVFTNAESVKLYLNDEYVGQYYPDKDKFSHLPHPPIIIKDMIGDRLAKETLFSKSEQHIIKKILLSMNANHMTLTLKAKLMMFFIMKKKKMNYKDALLLVEKYLFSWTKEGRVWRIEGIEHNKVVSNITMGPVTRRVLKAKADSHYLIIKETWDVTRIEVSEVDEYGNPLIFSHLVIEVTTSDHLILIGPSLIPLQNGIAAFYVRTDKKRGRGVITIKGDGHQPLEVVIQVE